MGEFIKDGEIISRDYYPYVTRSLIRLFGEGALTNVIAIDVEPNYGYASRISYIDGSHRVTYGNDLGLNAGAASDLAKDKGHAKFMLRTLGVNCPAGDEFLLPWWQQKIGTNQLSRGNALIKSASMAEAYAEHQLGYPLYVKPIDGSKGADIFVVDDAGELASVIEYYERNRVRVMMLEEPINLPDYRIVTLDDELISAYRRIPFSIIGNGQNSVEELLLAAQARYEDEGRDTRIDSSDPHFARHIEKQGLSLASIPNPDEEVVIAPISNLSAGGTSVDVTTEINSRWSGLSAFVAKNFNLRLCGLDLACDDITRADADYCVLEVNAAPGLDHYASSGDEQRQTVDRLYTRVFNTLPPRP